MLATLPFPLFIRLLSLLNLGWFGLGLFTLVISTFSRRSIVGFLAGVALNFVGLIIYKGSFSPAITSLSFPQHMILNLQYAKMQELLPVSSFHFALLYWSFWILLLLLSGMQLGKRKDFFGGAHAMKKLSIIRVISFNLHTSTRWRLAFLSGLFFVLEGWKSQQTTLLPSRVLAISIFFSLVGQEMEVYP